MKMLVAITLVVVAMVSAEAPNQKEIFQRQTAAPYQPRGWRPNGPAFSPTSGFQKQQLAPEPQPSYGPPPSPIYGPPSETTDIPTTTESITEDFFQGEDLKSELLRKEQKPEKIQSQPEPQVGQVYVVLPPNQDYIYTSATRQLNAALVQPREPKKDVEIIKEPKLAPVQAIPALAKIQAAQIQAPVMVAKYEQVPQVLQYQQLQAVPYLSYSSSLSQSVVHTPYSDSFVQVYQ